MNVNKLAEEAKGPQAKYEVKLELNKLDVRVSKTSVFKIQMRCIGIFKLVSKKYQIDENENPRKDGKEFDAEINFEDDILVKSTLISKNKESG